MGFHSCRRLFLRSLKVLRSCCTPMRRPLRSFSIRLVILVTLVLTLSRGGGTAIVTQMLPALSRVIEAVDDRLQVDHAIIVSRSVDTVSQLKATPIRVLFLSDRMRMPSFTFDPSTLLGRVLQPVIFLIVNVPLGFVGVMQYFREYLPTAPNLLDQQFAVLAPNRTWVTDYHNFLPFGKPRLCCERLSQSVGVHCWCAHCIGSRMSASWSATYTKRVSGIYSS